ncbi:uncharacterized acetyltransferase At3g50280-like [Spinacia oleracea]|uniref:Uncharacterized acetyltransferase At3g50280-like n=1 Tax=Spinacia oleracea TaxID=3562 RepID=A0ABM3RNG2_SPIOL|nr:uncharacterized acetyltransferase At3g50280-like [Spinacia oleracea]
MVKAEQETLIKLVSECFVKPKHEIEAAKQPYHLGPMDLIMLNMDPIHKGFLFSLKNSPLFSSSESNESNDIDEIIRTRVVSNLLENLKHSLSIALVHFYPLAGRLTTQKQPEQNTSSIFIDCNKGSGARFIHATAFGLTMDHIVSPDDVSLAHSFFELGEKYVNYDGHTKSLLSIQVTELIDGVFIGFSINHGVVDGTSFIHFVNVLSEIFRSVKYDILSSRITTLFST